MHCGVMLIPAMIPLFPDDGHLTVVYGGEDPPGGQALTMQIVMRHAATQVQPFAARTMGVNLHFGEDKNEPVLLVGLTPELVILRSLMQQFNKSEYSEFRPHIAIPGWHEYMRGMHQLPQHVYFNKIEFWLGDDHVGLWLGTGQEVD